MTRHHLRSFRLDFARHRLVRHDRGQGMTEYLIIVALIAVAAIGVYTGFGDILRGQTATAALALSGNANVATSRQLVTDGSTRATDAARAATLKDFEKTR